jgi:hypothetical protein
MNVLKELSFTIHNFLHVRDELGNILGISSGDKPTLAQISLALTTLGRKNMAGEGTPTLDFSRCGFCEPFSGTAVCLDFRHCILLR